MGANLCTLFHPISNQNFNSESPSSRDDNSLTLKKENQGRFCKILKRKMEMETDEKKIVPNLTLEDWILASPGLKPDYLYACNKQSKKKVHPCVSKFHASNLLAEAEDSLCLDRQLNNRHEESEEISKCSSIGTTLTRKSQKRVRFDLPHSVIFFLPDEPCSPQEKHPYYGSESEGSFYSSICGENSFDSSVEEPLFRLAVDVLPQVFVSSKV